VKIAAITVGVDQKTAEIVTTAFAYKSKHQFQLFKDSKSETMGYIRILEDAGYQG